MMNKRQYEKRELNDFGETNEVVTSNVDVIYCEGHHFYNDALFD